MSTRVVCDASALVALLLDDGPAGTWATEALTGADLAAPSLVEFECANIIRRLELAGRVSADQAAQAHADLLDMAIEPWPTTSSRRGPGSCGTTCRSTTAATSP